MINVRDNLPLDDLASMLAGDAGEIWIGMAEFPGYKRRVWRDAARAQLRKQVPEARIECLPPTWDGRDGICFIRRPGND